MPGKRCLTVHIVLLLVALCPAVAWSQAAGLGPYSADAGFLEIGEGPETPKAEIFYMAYTLDDAEPSDRPVTFVWNGGPGASSIYLHMLSMGPMIIEGPGDGSLPPAPARLIENPHTWLHFTDLVFIDPVGTGFSRALPQGKEKADPKPFFDADRDLASLGEVMRIWLTRNGRWASPKGIAGESYGGRRVAALSLMLMEDFAINLNWAVMISPALNDAIDDSDTQYGLLGPMVLLPSYAAVTSYHGEAPEDLQAHLAEVEAYALGEYASGLARLARASDAEAQTLYARVAEITGMPVEDIARDRGRVALGDFITIPLKGEGLVIDPYDGTQTDYPPLPDREAQFAIDRTLTALSGILAAPFLTYVRETLGVETDRPYEFLNRSVNQAFDRDTRRGGPEDVANALAINPDLRVLVVHGLHDLVTPYFKTRFTLEQTVRVEADAARLVFRDFEGGHMFYMRASSQAAFFEAARRFYEDP